MTHQSDTYTLLGRTLTTVSSARIRPALWSQARRIASQFGLTHTLVVDAHAMALGMYGAILYTDLTGRAVQMMEREPSHRHPLLSRSRSDLQPFRLSELRDDPKHGPFDWPGFMPAQAINGDGLVVPVFENATLQTLFVFVGDRPHASDSTLVALQSVACAIHSRLKEMRDTPLHPGSSHITAREAQCLQGLEEGSSDDEIAALLGISKRTVRFHVDNLKKKFGVASRTQVLAKRLKGARGS